MLTGLGLTDSLGEGASQAQQAAGRAGTAAAAGALEGFEDEPVCWGGYCGLGKATAWRRMVTMWRSWWGHRPELTVQEPQGLPREQQQTALRRSRRAGRIFLLH